ncbi:AAA family ATPase [Vibrio litoralis]|uniref:AAA family ATPase n=1 Tax=Vibrio litoralis TaxID=335972 RepID=UPI0003F87D1F|nr:ATP-binding protein [Vibrio litoralis]
MLIQFSVKNFRSIKDEITLQLIKGSGNELSKTNTFDVDAKGAANMGLVRSAVIYGANAAGKSNIIKALAEMKWLVSSSASKLQSEDTLDVEPFMFASDSISQPTEFDIDFIIDGTRYQYGFSATKQRIIEEWLFAYPNGRAQTWFNREYNEESHAYIWSKDSYLTGTKSVWKEATRDNALFLSTAIQLNSKQLEPIYTWFTQKLNAVGFDGIDPTYTAKKIHENKDIKDVLDFLKAGDLGIDDIQVEAKEFNLSELPDGLPTELKKAVAEKLKDTKTLTVKTGHKSLNGGIHYLDLNDESDGTQRIFSLAAPLVESLEEGLVVFIDELHNSLHPSMVKFLVSLFNDPIKNKNNAQLIFTTHETSILSQEVFRRDQIWFCEKNKEQSTSIYSLSDFHVRKGIENIERNYLSGKYGALPFIKKIFMDDK